MSCLMCRTADELKESIEKMCERRSSKSSNDPATRIERTLDNQLNALRDINSRAAEVERMLESMGVPVR